jgi:esterase
MTSVMASEASVLAHNVVLPQSGVASSYVLFFHGILGTGGNLRTVARRMLEGDERGAILVDLRRHGRSQEVRGPDTIEQAARDVAPLLDQFHVSAVVGHSFGGKVALELLAQQPALQKPSTDVFVLDSTPSARLDARGSEGTMDVLDVLDDLPASLPNRAAFVDFLAARGLAKPIVEWLAMNVVRVTDPASKADLGVRFALEMPAIRKLIDDYLHRDTWAVVESPPGGAHITFVAGGKSNVLSTDDLARIERLTTTTGGLVQLRTLPNAGHWVHVDDPDGLVAALRVPSHSSGSI